MLSKALSELTPGDIRELLTEKREEGGQLEYKRELPGSSDEEKVRLLLKPVCSFANSRGGDLIYGVDAPEGIPTAILGLARADVDGVIRRVNEILLAGIEPRVSGIQLRWIELREAEGILILRIPKSWIGPHRVVKSNRFYARTASGTYEMDISQIRQAMRFGDSLHERYESYLAERLISLSGDSLTERLISGTYQAIHVVPIISLTRERVLHAHELRLPHPEIFAWSRSSGGIDDFLAFEGRLAENFDRRGKITSRALVLRSGTVEFLHAYYKPANECYLPSLQCEEDAIESVTRAFKVFRKLQIEPPAWVSLSLYGVKGWLLGTDSRIRIAKGEARPFQKDDYHLSSCEVSSFDDRPIDILRPSFDIMWNCAGYEVSANWNDENKPAKGE